MQRKLKPRQESDSFVGDSKDQIQRSIAIHGQNPPAVGCVHEVQPVNHPTNQPDQFNKLFEDRFGRSRSGKRFMSKQWDECLLWDVEFAGVKFRFVVESGRQNINKRWSSWRSLGKSPKLGLNFGDSCNVSAIGYGIVDSSCVCQPYCPNLEAKVGDACVNLGGAIGIIDANCNCKADELDCPILLLNIGDSCNTAIGNSGIVDSNCNCQ